MVGTVNLKVKMPEEICNRTVHLHWHSTSGDTDGISCQHALVCWSVCLRCSFSSCYPNLGAILSRVVEYKVLSCPQARRILDQIVFFFSIT